MTEREFVVVVVMLSPDLLQDSSCCLQETLVPIARAAAGRSASIGSTCKVASVAENFLAQGHSLMKAAQAH